jgi:mannose-6-phosphate isomerase
MPDPIRLRPELYDRVWGRTCLAPWFPDPGRPVGEAWYVADRDLALLVKLIFTSQQLSVQVHPDDGEDGPRGKTEMWHILDAGPDAVIALGFREPITRERLRDAVQTGQVEHLLNWVPVKAGDTYYTPAHTVHAIGAGIVLAEIQQHSDITYRLWDYGRGRELHVEKAIPLCDLGVHPGASHPVPLADGREELVRSRHFVTELIRLDGGRAFTPEPRDSQLCIFLAGSGTIGGRPFQPGEVWYLPTPAEVHAESPARFLRTWSPG